MATTEEAKDAKRSAKKDEDVEKALEAEERDDEETGDDDGEESGSHGPDEKVAAPAMVRTSGARNVATIAVRELRSYFDSLVAYVVLGGSMAALGLYFFTDLPVTPSFWRIDRASMSHMFEFFPLWLSVIVIPLVTMRALAEEKRSGTLELLITMPVRDSEVILGKYLGALAMLLILFAATAIYPIAMFKWPWSLGPLDLGPVSAGYLGLVLFSMAGLAVGLLFSSITESQIIAFFVTAFVLTLLCGIGYFAEGVRGWVGDAMSFVSFQSRFQGFERGLIDTKAVVYFLSIATICLLLSFRSLESRKWS
jgi:ABC-2 type transport system permease protein